MLTLTRTVFGTPYYANLIKYPIAKCKCFKYLAIRSYRNLICGGSNRLNLKILFFLLIISGTVLISKLYIH